MFFFYENDYLGKVFRLVFEAHRVWGNPFPEVLPFFSLFKTLGPHVLFERVLFYLPLWVYGLTGLLILLAWVRANTKFSREILILLAILSFGVGVFGLVIWRAGFDNLLRTLPPFYILSCYLLHRAHRWALGRSFLAAVPRIKKNLLNLLAVALPFLFCYEMNVHHGFYAGSIGARWEPTRPVKLDRMRVRAHPAEAQWLEEVVDRIEIYTDPGDPILALPLNPVFYFLTGRTNPTAYDWVLPGMLDGAAESALVRTLTARPPKLIVYVDIAIDGREERRLSRYAPKLFQFIVEHYRFEEMIGLFQILLPKDPETARREG